MSTWHPLSWQAYELLQQPEYPDPEALASVCQELASLPPLVTPAEIDLLNQRLSDVYEGRQLILHAGDCSEAFSDCAADRIKKKLWLLKQLSVVMGHQTQKSVLTIGRIAGQYAKPRSALTETQNGISLPAFRGELINGLEFTTAARTPDPNRMLRGYSLASLTLNYIRALSEDIRNADLLAPDNLPDALNRHPKYKEVLQTVRQSVNWLAELGVKRDIIQSPSIFTSHEALLLCYESALTRQVNGRWYCLSTHMPWVGMRTAFPTSAHIEYLRGLANPVAIKVGPRMSPDWLSKILRILTNAQPDRPILLIHRFGHRKIGKHLPALLCVPELKRRSVIWLCDPMHGNTLVDKDNRKFRRVSDVLTEMNIALKIHADYGSRLHGLHLEVSADNVTECLGGVSQIRASELSKRYTTQVDPRLTPAQAMEIVIRFAESWRHNFQAQYTPIIQTRESK